LPEQVPTQPKAGRPFKNAELVAAELQVLREGEEAHERRKVQMHELQRLRLRQRSRGVAAGFRSNRLQAHQHRKKKELSIVAKLAVCTQSIEARAEFATEDEWVAAMMIRFEMRKDAFQLIISSKAELEKLVSKAKAGLLPRVGRKRKVCQCVHQGQGGQMHSKT
jgi:hypothetical protein